jgi:hypothetical protein
MANLIKSALAVAGSVALLAGCATGPYYQDAGYGYGTDYGYAPAPVYSDGYAGYGYGAPAVGFGVAIEGSDRHEWHGDQRGEWHGDRGAREWHGDRGGDRAFRGDGGDRAFRGDGGGRGGHDFTQDHGQNSGG